MSWEEWIEIERLTEQEGRYFKADSAKASCFMISENKTFLLGQNHERRMGKAMWMESGRDSEATKMTKERRHGTVSIFGIHQMRLTYVHIISSLMLSFLSLLAPAYNIQTASFPFRLLATVPHRILTGEHNRGSAGSTPRVTVRALIANDTADGHEKAIDGSVSR